jgi:hypothetical protein
MLTRVLLASLAVVAQLPALPPGSSCPVQFIPLETGTSYGDSSGRWWPAKAIGEWRGHGWLGWVHGGDALLPVAVEVRERRPGDGEDMEASIEAIPGVDFLVRCVPALGQQAIRALEVVNHSLSRGEPFPLALGSRTYELRLEASRDDLFDARVVLREGTRRQVLYDAGGFADESHYDVVWAGDLDADGRLDLVTNFSRKYSDHPYALLLSSAAAGDGLVGEVAVFETGD